MKTLHLVAILLLANLKGIAQNTFPSSGKVGIGTTSPLSSLHIKDLTYEAGILLDAWANGYANIILKSNDKQWSMSKRPVAEDDRFSIYYNNGTTWSEYMSMTTNGYMGLGIGNPAYRLHVVGDAKMESVISSNLTHNSTDNFTYQSRLQGNNALTWGADSWSVNPSAWLSSSGGIKLFTDGIPRMVINEEGNIGIGTSNITDANFKLFVESGIRTRKVKVDQSSWPDYVFDRDYHLPTLSEVQLYIQRYGHLSGIPSAKEVALEGIDLGDNQAALLKKIEELMLYIIAQDKELKEQKNRLDLIEALLKTR